MKEDLGVKNMEVNGLTLPVSRYVFQDPFSHQLFYVFQIVTDDRVWQNAEGPVLGEPGRLQSAWNGRRNPGQRSLLVVNQGADNLPEAELDFQKLLQDSLVISPTPPSTP